MEHLLACCNIFSITVPRFSLSSFINGTPVEDETKRIRNKDNILDEQPGLLTARLAVNDP